MSSATFNLVLLVICLFSFYQTSESVSCFDCKWIDGLYNENNCENPEKPDPSFNLTYEIERRREKPVNVTALKPGNVTGEDVEYKVTEQKGGLPLPDLPSNLVNDLKQIVPGISAPSWTCEGCYKIKMFSVIFRGCAPKVPNGKEICLSYTKDGFDGAICYCTSEYCNTAAIIGGRHGGAAMSVLGLALVYTAAAVVLNY